MRNKIGQTTLLSNNPYIELNNQGQIITLQLTQERHILGRDRHRANLVVPSDWLSISNYHALIKKSDDRYHIYDGDGYRPSTNGLFLERTRITPSEGYPLENGIEIKIGLDPQNQILLKYFEPNNPVGLTSVIICLKAFVNIFRGPCNFILSTDFEFALFFLLCSSSSNFSLAMV